MILLQLVFDGEFIPEFCPKCGKPLVTSPILEAYSYQVTGYMYHCLACTLQISLHKGAKITYWEART